MTGSWRRPYKTKDGYLCMMAYTERHWRKFWAMVGRPEVCDDPRFNSIAARSKNIVALYELAGACLADKTTDEWLARLRELEIPCGAHVEPRRPLDDPQLKAGGLLQARRAPERRRDCLYRHAGTLRRRPPHRMPDCSRGWASTASNIARGRPGRERDQGADRLRRGWSRRTARRGRRSEGAGPAAVIVKGRGGVTK